VTHPKGAERLVKGRTVKVERISPVTVVSLQGKLSIEFRPIFEAAVRVLVDLGEMDCAANAGLRVLMQADRQA